MKKIASLTLASLSALFLACSHASASGNDPGAATTTAALGTAPNGEAIAADLYRIPLGGLPSMGNPDALVTIVEFTDYQCPFCQRAEETMQRLRASYGDAVRVVVAERPHPFHDRARPAALAALAADAQGKFEAMHTRLFALAGSLEEDSIAGAARDAGLDLARFAVDRNGAPLAPSEQLADRFSVRGTPTFFIAGRRLVGAQPYEAFHDVVEERLGAARALVANGTRPRDVYAALTATGADHVDPPKETNDEAPSCGHDCAEGATAHVSDKIEDVPTDGAPARGPARAPITIVVFGDFECPFTARAETTTLRAVEQAHPGDVRVVFKNTTIPTHVHAPLAARAALAADAQGRFWDYHDRLLAHDGVTLDRAGLLKVAGELGLDVPRFTSDLEGPSTADRLARDASDARALGVQGTPTFFVNGRRIVGAQPQAVFEATIAKAR